MEQMKQHKEDKGSKQTNRLPQTETSTHTQFRREKKKTGERQRRKKQQGTREN